MCKQDVLLQPLRAFMESFVFEGIRGLGITLGYCPLPTPLLFSNILDPPLKIQ